MTAAAPHPPHAVGRAAAFLPPALCAVAVVSLGAALAAAPLLAETLRDHFYQTQVMALVHALTLLHALRQPDRVPLRGVVHAEVVADPADDLLAGVEPEAHREEDAEEAIENAGPFR